jgi:hypothetical protein
MAARVLAPWEERPQEVAYLLNPAFCALLLRESVRGYKLDQPNGMPLPIAYLVLPVVLHRRTRESLPTIRTRIHAWIEGNPEARVGFGVRTRSMVPYTREALVFAIQHGMLELDDTAVLGVARKRFSRFSPPEGSEPAVCLEKAHDVGRLLARAGDVPTTYSMWGIRP